MRIAAVFQRLASAAAVFFSPHGGVAEQARLRGVERQTLYRQADEALNAVEGSAAEQQRLQLQQRLHDCQEQLAQCQQQLRQHQRYGVLLDPDKQAEFASCGQAEGVSLPVLVRLLRPLLGEETPSVASLGRLTQQASRRASGLLEVLDEHSHPLVHQASADELYSGRKPVLMAVEPDSLCWLTARLSDKRDGQEWAKEFKRLPALEQVNRDAGEGLQKGVNLTNQERRRLKKQGIAEQLDHFHTLREGSRTLRRMQGRVSRAIKKAELAQRREERCDRRGQPKTGGSGAACVKWRKAEQVFDAWAAQDKVWQEVKGALRLFTPDGELNSRERAEAILTRACKELRGADWDKTKRYLKQAETLTFLDRARQRLAELPLAGAVAQAAVRLEGLRRHPELMRGTNPQAAVMRGLALAWSVVMAKAGAPGQQAQAAAAVVQGGESGPQTQAATAVVQGGESDPQTQAAAAVVQAGASGPQTPTAAAVVQTGAPGPQTQATAVMQAGESGPQVPTAAVVVQAGESVQQAQATAAMVQAAVRLEGLRRHPELMRGTNPQAAVMRGLALAWSVVMAKAGAPGQQAQAAAAVVQGGESGPQTQAATAVVQGGESDPQTQAAAAVVQAGASGPQTPTAAAVVQAGASGPQTPTAAAVVQTGAPGPQTQATAVMQAGESGPQVPTAAVVVQAGESVQQAQATAAMVQAAVRLEGLRRHPEWTHGTSQQAAVMCGGAGVECRDGQGRGAGQQAQAAAAVVQGGESGPQTQAATAVVQGGESDPQTQAAAAVVQAGESVQQAQATAAMVQAAVRLEGLRRHPEWTHGTSQQAAVMRGLALAWSVVMAKAGEPGQQTQAAVRAILRQAWRGSSAVEGLNSVLRMQQGRHRRLSQGLLDLKRLYWNCRPLRTGHRKKQTPYARLGLRLPDMTWWKLLHLPPEQLRQHMSAQQVAA